MSMDMQKYERVTKRAGWHEQIDLTDELGYSYIYQRLSDLENAIEDGELVKYSSKIKTLEGRIEKLENIYEGYRKAKIQELESKNKIMENELKAKGLSKFDEWIKENENGRKKIDR